jgi:hypothetical protein
MKLFEAAKRLLVKVDAAAGAAFETPRETRGLPAYSRHNPNPAWGDERPAPGDRVVGRQVVAEGPRPPGETILSAADAFGFGHEFAPPQSDDGGGAVEFMRNRIERIRGRR